MIQRSGDPLWISERDVVALMDMSGAIAALEAGLIEEASGHAQNMLKTHVEWDSSTLHAIGAVFPQRGFCGTKTWAHTATGATPLLILFDSGDGSLKTVIEAFALGQMRTAAASGVATRWLAADDAATLAMIGTGKQSLAQVAAVIAVRPLQRVRVFGRDKQRRDGFIERIESELNVEASPAPTIAEAVSGASIITLATRASEPILDAKTVSAGTHINSVGAIVPSRAEVCRNVLERSTQIVTDSVSQARKLSRELMEFFDSEPEGWKRVKPLADIVAGKCPRTAADDLTLFKPLGVGISDLSIGIEVYQRAVGAGLGRTLPAPERTAPRLRSQSKSLA